MRIRMNKYSVYLTTICMATSSSLVFALTAQDQFLDAQYISAGINWSKLPMSERQIDFNSKSEVQYSDLMRLEPIHLQSALDSDAIDLFDEFWVSSYKLQNQNREHLDLRSQRKADPAPRFKPTIYQSKGIYSDANVRIETDDKIVISVGPRAAL